MQIKFEYGFQSQNGIVKKVYDLAQIPRIAQICDVWDELPIKYVRQFTGLKDKNGVDIYEGDYLSLFILSDVARDANNEIAKYEVKHEISTFVLQRLDLPFLWGNLQRIHEAAWDCEVIGNIHEVEQIKQEPSNLKETDEGFIAKMNL